MEHAAQEGFDPIDSFTEYLRHLAGQSGSDLIKILPQATEEPPDPQIVTPGGYHALNIILFMLVAFTVAPLALTTAVAGTCSYIEQRFRYAVEFLFVVMLAASCLIIGTQL